MAAALAARRRRAALLAGLLLWATRTVAAQATPLLTPARRDFGAESIRYEVVHAQLAPSYITLPWVLGNRQLFFFEAGIAPHLALGWRGAALVATPSIVLRMFDDSTNSAPIKTPSFMPHVAFYYWGRPLPQRPGALHLLALTAGHHSNGQSGAFLKPDSSGPNTTDGSFSTNFLQLSYHWVFRQRGHVGSVQVAYRHHLPINEDVELRSAAGTNQYGRRRLLVSVAGLVPFLPEQRPPLGLVPSIDAYYILDRHFQGAPGASWKRLGVSLTLTRVFQLDEPLGVFVNYYSGQDYYNIWYKQRLRVLRGGIALTSITSFRRP
jgi:hypothetical protein